MYSRKDILNALKLASLRTRINYMTIEVAGQPSREKACVTEVVLWASPTMRSVGRGLLDW